jgi:hypothetical protein
LVQGKRAGLVQADDDPDDDEDTSEPGTVLGAPHKIAQILKAIKKHAGSVELLNIIRGKLYGKQLAKAS